VIEANPGDVDSHNKYVMALRNTLLREDVSKSKRGGFTFATAAKENRVKIAIDKPRLLAICKDLKRAVLRNTKDPLELLD
jgi:hypothetical protein